MAPMTRAQRREYDAKQRRSQKYRERLQREQARALSALWRPSNTPCSTWACQRRWQRRSSGD